MTHPGTSAAFEPTHTSFAPREASAPIASTDPSGSARGSVPVTTVLTTPAGSRPVRGALPCATAKAAIEGLTRAVAVDHGPQGVRTNAVALRSIDTERCEAHRTAHPDVDAQMAAPHPPGRVGTPAEVAAAVAFLPSPSAVDPLPSRQDQPCTPPP